MPRDKGIAHTRNFDNATELHRQGRLQEAEQLYQAVLNADPQNFPAVHSLGVIFLQRGLPERAADSLGLALRLAPSNAAVHRDYGAALHALGLSREAIASFDTSIALDAKDGGTHYLRGNALLRAGRPQEALDAFDIAISLRPDFFEAINNKANALRELDRLDEAVIWYRQAVALKPNLPVPSYNLAFALQDLGCFEESLAAYNRAIGLKPDYHDARKARASLYLLQGRWDKGLPDFEHRVPANDALLQPRLRAVWYWSGENLENRTIVIYGDGAFGDMVQFGRYIPLLSDRGARVTVLLPPQFHGIFAGAFPKAGIETGFDAPQTADFRCEVMSLPFLFKATLENLPPPLALSRDEERIARRSSRFAKTKFSIGICWQGNPDRHIDKGRSVPLAAFAPIARIPGVQLFSLQKKHGLEQLDELPRGMEVESLGADVDEGADAFVDTAAAMASLDLIVTSDTAVAHLAATLRRPTWIALRHVPEWRWLLERHDSPWYPTVRLFRKKQLDQWDQVFNDLAEALVKEMGQRG